jgi:hypothetical protein
MPHMNTYPRVRRHYLLSSTQLISVCVQRDTNTVSEGKELLRLGSIISTLSVTVGSDHKIIQGLTSIWLQLSANMKMARTKKSGEFFNQKLLMQDRPRAHFGSKKRGKSTPNVKNKNKTAKATDGLTNLERNKRLNELKTVVFFFFFF